MKKGLLSILLCLCMVFTLPSAALAAGGRVTRITITMDKPAVGKTPATTATVPSADSTYVKSVKWYGEFDEDGKFKPGMKYTVDIVLAVKDGIDRTIQLNSKSNVTINGEKVTNGSVDATGKTATIQYYYGPFDTPEGYEDSSEFGYLSSGTGKIQNVPSGKIINVYDIPAAARTSVGELKNGDTVKVLCAYVGGKGQTGCYHVIEYNGEAAYLPAYQKGDLVTKNYVLATRDDGPAATGDTLNPGDFGFATLNTPTGLDAYLRPAPPDPDNPNQSYVGKIQNGEKVYLVAVGVSPDSGLIPYDAVLWRGRLCYVMDRDPGKLWKNAAVLGATDFQAPSIAKVIDDLPLAHFMPKPSEAPQLMIGNTPVTTALERTNLTVESVTYDQTHCQPYSWVTATVTYKAKENYVFADKFALPVDAHIAMAYTVKSPDTLVVAYTAWVGAEGLEVKPTQAMMDYAELHEDDTANAGAHVATGKRNDPLGDMPVSGIVGDFDAAKVWKFPTMAENASVYYGDARLGRVWETMRIYDLHADRLFPETVGQWYLVECNNKIGFVPASYVKNVKENDAWDGAPAVQKDSEFKFAGGSGSRADPYLIATADQLNAIRYGLDKHYKLTADIDLSTWGNWTPIGGNPAYGGIYNATNQKADKVTQTTGAFTGTLNGNHHVISGLTIVDHRETPYLFEAQAARGYALFAKLAGPYGGAGNADYDTDAYRLVYDLGIVNYNIDISYTKLDKKAYLYAGALCASPSCGGGRIDNVYTSGGSIKVNFDGNVVPQIFAGSLVADFTNGCISNCYNTSPVTITTTNTSLVPTGIVTAAGLAGSCTTTRMRDCFNTGAVTVAMSSGHVACGLVGQVAPPEFAAIYNYPETGLATTIYNCYNAGALTGYYLAGAANPGTTDIYVHNFYNSGKMTPYVPTSEHGDNIPQSYDVIDINHELIMRYGTRFIHDNGQENCIGSSWQPSAKLGRPVLKVHLEDSLPAYAGPAAAVL